ncbi:sensor histidine kinase [Croceicoccus hydrothermalis]|uniref:sensor histidine kinase n=1 Tax=Croceicoccus hydrothermalis TaxID=2867964 RepID=UPI001EFACDF9|nr:ATP-binding protein [Croceicoccus hydrothermalis]
MRRRLSILSRRILPRSLQGQMLLAVALALLLGQAISAVIIYRAEVARADNSIAHTLAFRLIGAQAFDARVGRRDAMHGMRGRGGRRSMGLVSANVSPRTSQDRMRGNLQERLAQVLSEQGIAFTALDVFERPLADDPPAQNFLRRRFGASPPPDRSQVIVAAMRPAGASHWIVARDLPPARTGRFVRLLLLQTVLTYIVLVGAIALLLRRITGPLKALTGRVEDFSRDPAMSADARVQPAGPTDTRRLIIAHNRMEQRIGALLDEKNVMLGAIGHDLKTPLAALRVRIESVEDEDERARMAATIEDIVRTLDDILSLARVGRPSDPLETTELSALVVSVVEEFEDMGDPVELGETQRIVLPLRATWLRRALRNLIGNAVRYAGGADVSVERRGNRAIVRVMDRGPGIPDGQISAMMEPFARGDPSRNRGTGGAGLGLTLARAIAEQHGGTLILANRDADDGGATGLCAELSLPV